MFIKPSPGVRVLDPATLVALPEGEATEVPDNDIYWNRRINDGDVLVLANPTTEKGGSGK